MKISDVQSTLTAYFNGNNITIMLMQYAKILAIVYPIYLLLANFEFLHFITGIFGSVSPVLYFAYLIGMIMCFAKNDMFTLCIALGIKAVDNILNFAMFSYSTSYVLYVIIYGYLAYLAYSRHTVSSKQ